MNINILNTNNFNISILLCKNMIYIYAYNKHFYCFFKMLKSSNLKLNNNSYLEIESYFNTKYVNMNDFLKQFYLCRSAKIKFTGKGYKIKKNTKKSVILRFNKAHITILWWNNFIIKRLKKYKIYIKYIQGDVVNKVIDTRRINIFTRKKLKESRQILL